ncbi:hypothetical protein [Caldivirga sp. UBA161]|uniref:hypothetical protein n=1 Tax=Caldivirga sp. UBA161 TaxID=1915569 RepID=UPI0025C6FA21|nr:hypothetical protein [Caldivirga sp. UBA161]
MNTKSLLRITGIIGFIIAVIATYIYVTHILIPAILPILIHQIEAQSSSGGASISQCEVSRIPSFAAEASSIGIIVGLVIGWLIELPYSAYSTRITHSS